MITATKALVLFCEGPHDVAFCKLVFEILFSAASLQDKFTDYPFPFNSLFKTCLEKHAAKDLSLDMAHKFFLPDKTLVAGEWLILLFNVGGKNNPQNPKTLLNDLLVLLPEASVFSKGSASVIEKINYIFLYDADDQSPTDVFRTCRTNFQLIGDINLIPNEFVEHESNNCAGTCNQSAVYVWTSESGNCGTLEDSLIPILRQTHPTLIDPAYKFLETSFAWKTNSTTQKERIAETARLNKAVITLMGQRKKPGSSMNVIVGQTDILSEEQFEKSKEVKLFADFVSHFSGLSQ